MRRKLGRLIGKRLIKQALDLDTNDGVQYEKEPISEGSDKDDRRISEMFDSLNTQNEMPDEDVEKVSAEAAFKDRPGIDEKRPEEDLKRQKNTRDIDRNTESVEKAWKEHDGFDGSSVNGVNVDSVPEPGPPL